MLIYVKIYSVKRNVEIYTYIYIYQLAPNKKWIKIETSSSFQLVEPSSQFPLAERRDVTARREPTIQEGAGEWYIEGVGCPLPGRPQNPRLAKYRPLEHPARGSVSSTKRQRTSREKERAIEMYIYIYMYIEIERESERKRVLAENRKQSVVS